jgi:predicted transcriptional regulator
MEGHMRSHEDRILRFTTDIVTAYLQNNKMETASIPELLDVVHKKISELYPSQTSDPGLHTPAVDISDSVTPDHIICLEDGKKFKMLKKHLRTQYDMSPEDYRAKWNLPPDYPMVAPNYAVKRQALAKASGLGRSR